MDLASVGDAVTEFVHGEVLYDSEHGDYFVYHRMRDSFRVLYERKFLRRATTEEYAQLNDGRLTLRADASHRVV